MGTSQYCNEITKLQIFLILVLENLGFAGLKVLDHKGGASPGGTTLFLFNLRRLLHNGDRRTKAGTPRDSLAPLVISV